jgi:hypoxanthine phosphoribosyltransferase
MTQSDPPAADAGVHCLIASDELDRRVRELARQVSADYAGKRPILVGVLKGSWVFLADLARHLSVPARFDFVKLSTYGSAMHSSGSVRIDLDLTLPVAGEDVLLVEDIVDTGLSSHWLMEHLRGKRPASLRLCALLDKPSRRAQPVPVDYVGFTIPDRFVVGYGIDYDERYRQLPYVGYLTRGDGP